MASEMAANLQGTAHGQGRVYQVGSGTLHVDNSTHYHGALRSPELAKLIDARPPAWEYLLCGRVLSEGMDALQGKWLSYTFSHTMRAPHYKDDKAAIDYLVHASREAGRITGSLTHWFNPALERRAFGRLGESGNASAIEHFARSLCTLLEEFIDLAIELRSVDLPSRLDRLRQLLLTMFGEPIRDTYHFFEKLIVQIEEVPGLLSAHSGDAPIRIELEYVLKIDPAVSKAIQKEFRELRRGI